MPKVRKPPPISEKYEVQINPNTLAIALESALKSATRPLYEEIGQLRHGSEPDQSRAVSLPSEYVENVRRVVAGIKERLRTEALRQQADRIGEAANSLSGRLSD